MGENCRKRKTSGFTLTVYITDRGGGDEKVRRFGNGRFAGQLRILTTGARRGESLRSQTFRRQQREPPPQQRPQDSIDLLERTPTGGSRSNSLIAPNSTRTRTSRKAMKLGAVDMALPGIWQAPGRQPEYGYHWIAHVLRSSG